MIRLVSFLVVVGLLVTGSVWLADRPGSVVIHWLDRRFDTSVPALLVGMVALGALGLVLYRVLAGLAGIPGGIGRALGRRRLRKGLSALTDGFAALVAEDPFRARKRAGEANDALTDKGPSRLLLARAALQGEDADLARKLNEDLLSSKDTEIAGLRGLMDLALAEGDKTAAATYAARAFERNGRAGWAGRALLDLQIAAGDTAAARKTLEACRKASLLPAEDANRLAAVMLCAEADAAMAGGNTYEATRLAKKATEIDGTFVPAVVRYATALGAEGNPRKGGKVIEDLWKRTPHPDLAAAYTALFAGEDVLKQVTEAEHLAETNPEHPESRILVARMALNADLWGQARSRLKPLIDSGHGDARVSLLMAGIEEGENHDPAKALPWLHKAIEQGAPEGWRCGSCGTPARAWAPSCPSCDTFNGLVWRTGRALVAVP